MARHVFWSIGSWQWGLYRGELLHATQVFIDYAKQAVIPPTNAVIRLDELYGNAAPLPDVLTSGLGLLARSKDYQLLDLTQAQRMLAGPPAMTRAFFGLLTAFLVELTRIVHTLANSIRPPSHILQQLLQGWTNEYIDFTLFRKTSVLCMDT